MAVLYSGSISCFLVKSAVGYHSMNFYGSVKDGKVSFKLHPVVATDFFFFGGGASRVQSAFLR